MTNLLPPQARPLVPSERACTIPGVAASQRTVLQQLCLAEGLETQRRAEHSSNPWRLSPYRPSSRIC